jgi:DNA polymerase-3 subunit delta
VITTLSGNSYLVSSKLDDLVSKFVAKHGELALVRIDSAEAKLAAVLEAVSSLPFLSPAKMVVLREPSASKEISEAIEQIISSTENTTELIVIEPSPDKRSTFYKTLKSKTAYEDFPNLDPPQLAKWLVDEAKKNDAQLSFSNASYLISRVGTNQQMLASELEKLSLYSAQISKDNIDLMTDKNPQSKVFDLLDAAFAGNKKKAQELYEEQRSQKVEPQNILALIVWQLHILALAKSGQGMRAEQIAKEAKLSPYPIQKAQSLAARLTDQKIAEMISELMEIDYKSKQTGLDINEALKTYIAAL